MFFVVAGTGLCEAVVSECDFVVIRLMLFLAMELSPELLCLAVLQQVNKRSLFLRKDEEEMRLDCVCVREFVCVAFTE